jgi:hypothetical protein
MGKRNKRKNKAPKDLQALGKMLGVPMRPGVRVKLDDGFYRIRRGKLVRIPDEWVGKPYVMCCQPKKWRQYLQMKKRPARELTKKQRRRGGQKDWDGIPREKRERALKKYGVNEAGNPVGGRRSGVTHPRQRSDRHVSARERKARDVLAGL